MQLDLNIDVKNLDGTPMLDGENPVKLGKALASQLAQSQTDDPLKTWTWATKLHAGEAIELDPSDVAKFRTTVMSLTQASDMLKAQVLLALQSTEG